MTLTGHIQNGAIVPDEPLPLPEGAEVQFAILPTVVPQTKGRRPLSERLSEVAGTAEGLPEDAARNLKHYLYGHPKR